MKTLVILLALTGLAGCSGSDALVTPTGPSFALNIGHWQPTPAELELPKPGSHE